MIRLDPVAAYRVVFITGFLVMLGANLPGQMSLDTVMQLYEGRHHVRETFGPAVNAWILGAFDSIVPGTGLYLAASGALGFGSFLALRTLRPGMSWLGPLIAIPIVLSPALLIHQGTIWKDILFANLGLASFVLLAHIAKVWTRPGRPWLAMLALVLMLALASQVRQNGLIAAAVAAIVMAWTVRAGGMRAMLGWSLGGLVSVVLVSMAMGAAAQPRQAGEDKATHVGIRILQHYDIIGAAAHDRNLRLEDINAASPVSERVIKRRGVSVYSAERVDYLDLDPAVGRALWVLPDGVVERQWRDLVLEHPSAYLAHRWDVFRWVFLTPMIDSCLPIHIGVDGPPEKLADLKIAAGVDEADRSLYNYGTWFLDTPVFSHLSYALVCAGAALLLLLRREPQDVAMAGLMIAALGFTASFFVVSIACDYRYLYFLDLSALAALAYLAIDPPIRALGGGRSR
ncbi:MAG TPA: hypothetical protein VFW47_02415 [Phenylobacterium sp.]|nr:hypothetical protein [Phenylobacterium sp.]